MKRLLLLLPLMLAAPPIANANTRELVDRCVVFFVREAAREAPSVKLTPRLVLERCACIIEKQRMGLDAYMCSD